MSLRNIAVPGALPIKENSAVEAPPDSERRRVTILNAGAPILEGTTPTFSSSCWAIITDSWFNLLTVLIPVGIILYFAVPDNYVAIFVTNFLAILPLAKLLGTATEELALRTGSIAGALLNVSFGNVIELLIAIMALAKDELEIVQTSLVGSILSNLLVVLGFCFLAGGIKFKVQDFSSLFTQTNASILIVAVTLLLLPACVHAGLDSHVTTEKDKKQLLDFSRGSSIVAILVYIGYLVFQLGTHKKYFAEGPATSKDDEQRPVVPVETPKLTPSAALGLLATVTVLAGVCVEFMVDSIEGLVETTSLKKPFIGLILIPLVGNAAEHVTAVTVAYKDKVDLAMGVAIGSSVQVSIFLIPLLVLIAWCLNKPLSLDFHVFIIAELFLSVFLVNQTVGDSASNWYEGWILIMVYVIITLSTLSLPESLFQNE